MGARNLVLIGFMGTGKTTIGRLCAERLGYRFRDSDTEIESRIGCSIAQYFSQKGEAAFREIEREVIAELAEESDQVISTGGGVVLDPENAMRLREGGWVVLLQATPDAILARVGDTRSRPLLANAADPLARIEELLAPEFLFLVWIEVIQTQRFLGLGAGLRGLSRQVNCPCQLRMSHTVIGIETRRDPVFPHRILQLFTLVENPVSG